MIHLDHAREIGVLVSLAKATQVLTSAQTSPKCSVAGIESGGGKGAALVGRPLKPREKRNQLALPMRARLCKDRLKLVTSRGFGNAQFFRCSLRI
jgi:hypothetical protein